MRLAMRMPPKKGLNGADANSDANVDPRDGESAEIIDLASRNGFPAVTERASKSDGLGLALGAVIVLGLGAVTLWSMDAARTGTAETASTIVASAPPPARAPGAAAPVNVAQVAPARAPRSDPAPSPVFSNNPNRVAGPATNPYATPTMVFDASAAAGAARLGETVAPAPIAATAGATSAPGGAVGSASEFASRIGGVGGAPAQAQPMANPTTTVTQGTLIPAILETAIDTDVPGFVRAVVSQDVRSFDGTKVLVPRSSRLVGQYQSGVQQGQKRAYVIWTRLIRPDGVSVNIASPAVAFDGTTGLQGDVNNHFFRRFGSAMLLSVVGGLSAIGSGGASVVLGGAGQGAASIAAQQDGAISPTIRVKMGEPIRVFTARDLDFSTVN